MTTTASQITSPTVVYSTVYSDADQRKRQSSASLAFVRRINREPVNSPHKWPVARKMFPFDDVIMKLGIWTGVLKNLVSSYCIWFHNTRATIAQFAKFYQHQIKYVLVRLLGHGKMQLCTCIYLHMLISRRRLQYKRLYIISLALMNQTLSAPWRKNSPDRRESSLCAANPLS